LQNCTGQGDFVMKGKKKYLVWNALTEVICEAYAMPLGGLEDEVAVQILAGMLDAHARKKAGLVEAGCKRAGGALVMWSAGGKKQVLFFEQAVSSLLAQDLSEDYFSNARNKFLDRELDFLGQELVHGRSEGQLEAMFGAARDMKAARLGPLIEHILQEMRRDSTGMVWLGPLRADSQSLIKEGWGVEQLLADSSTKNATITLDPGFTLA
jgi:hypothetical protein